MFGLESVVIQGLFKLTLAVFGVVIGRFTLLWMDKNEKFTLWLDGTDPMVQAVYKSGRFIAVAIIIGAAIG
jgi:hypothetical protein